MIHELNFPAIGIGALKLASVIVAFVTTAAAPLALVDGAQAADDAPALTATWMMARGGRLYDNWIAELEADRPKGNHPAYPKTGRLKGEGTWQCRECHGWDYRGKDGVYRTGQHFTGIKGVEGVRGMSQDTIAAIIRNNTHRFTEKQLPAAEIKALTLFLSRGQTDMARYIDARTGKAQGDAGRGAPVFQTICANCHGLAGKQIEFREERRTAYLGTYCRENPWKVLHKIRAGQPGVSMVTLTSFNIRLQVDVLSYCQTLPKK